MYMYIKNNCVLYLLTLKETKDKFFLHILVNIANFRLKFTLSVTLFILTFESILIVPL